MDKISPIKKRILQYIEYAKISKSFFCEKTGISYANIKGKSLESEFGGTQIAEILSIFGEISADWLLSGTGKMLRNQNVRDSSYTHAAAPLKKAQRTDSEGEYSKKNENTDIIDNLLQRLENQSEEIGRLRGENEYIGAENKRLKEEINAKIAIVRKNARHAATG